MARPGDQVKLRIDLRQLDRDVARLLRANRKIQNATAGLQVANLRVRSRQASAPRRRRGRVR